MEAKPLLTMEQSQQPQRAQPQAVAMPTYVGWGRQSMFDGASMEAYDRLSSHVSSATLIPTVTLLGDKLLKQTASQARQYQGAASLGQFLEGTFLPGESVLVGPNDGILFTSVTFKDYASQAVRHQTAGGVVVLTSKRLIFLSAMSCSKNTLQPFNVVKGKPTSYAVRSSVFDSKLFYPVDRTAVKALHLVMETGVEASASVSSTNPCIPCCPCFCQRSWSATPIHPAVHSNRVLVLSVELPPWAERTIVEIRLDNSVTAEMAKYAVIRFQEFMFAQGPPPAPAAAYATPPTAYAAAQ